MKRLQKSLVMALAFFLIFLHPLNALADPNSAANPGFIFAGKNLTIPVPTGHEGIDYLGVVATRYQPTIANSDNDNDYTGVVEVNALKQWFIPVPDGNPENMVLNFDEQAVRKALFSAFYDTVAELGEPFAHNLSDNNTKFKISVNHLFRTPEGENIVINNTVDNVPLEIYIQLAPAILGVTVVEAEGTYKESDTLNIRVQFSQAVKVSDMSPALTLNDGGLAQYSGDINELNTTLNFTYTVDSGNTVGRDNDVWDNKNYGLQITDFNKNTATIDSEHGVNAVLITTDTTNIQGKYVIDNTAPEEVNITSIKRNSLSDLWVVKADISTRPAAVEHHENEWFSHSLEVAFNAKDKQSGVKKITAEFFDSENNSLGVTNFDNTNNPFVKLGELPDGDKILTIYTVEFANTIGSNPEAFVTAEGSKVVLTAYDEHDRLVSTESLGFKIDTAPPTASYSENNNEHKLTVQDTGAGLDRFRYYYTVDEQVGLTIADFDGKTEVIAVAAQDDYVLNNPNAGEVFVNVMAVDKLNNVALYSLVLNQTPEIIVTASPVSEFFKAGDSMRVTGTVEDKDGDAVRLTIELIHDILGVIAGQTRILDLGPCGAAQAFDESFVVEGDIVEGKYSIRLVADDRFIP